MMCSNNTERKEKHMKKHVRILVCAITVLLCAASFCACDPDWYGGRRPVDQLGTKWVCEEYNMSFEVGEDGLVKNGVFKTEDGEIAFDLLWAVGTTHVIVYDADSFRKVDEHTNDYDTLFSGDCEFGRREFEIFVNYDPNDYFPDSCTLHFVRVDA